MRKITCATLATIPYSASATELIVSDHQFSLNEGRLLAIYDSSCGDLSTAKKRNRLELVRVNRNISSGGKLNVVRAQMGSAAIDFDDGTVWNVIFLPNLLSAEADVTDYGARAEEGFDSTMAFQQMADEQGFVSIPFSEIPFEIDSVITTRPTVFRAKNGHANLKLREPARQNSPGIVLGHNQSGIDRGVFIDGNATGRSCVRISADDCFCM